MRIDERTLEELAKKVEGFEQLLKSNKRDYDEAERDRQANSSLQKEVQELKAKIASTEFAASEHQVRALVEQRKTLEEDQKAFAADKKLEYNKGYAAAYVEVTSKMGSKL